MKHLSIFTFCILCSFLAFGNDNYYLADSTIYVGVRLIDDIDMTNSQFCQIKEKGKIIRYSPYEVKEYGFSKERVYVSKIINVADSSRRVFLRRLYDGNIILYYYRAKDKKTFYIEKDSNIIAEISKLNAANEVYTIQLQNLTKNCPEISDACKLVSYNKGSFTKLMSRYEKCKKRPFPHKKYGFLTGYDFYKLIPSNEQNINLRYFDFNFDSSVSIGMFFENPINYSDFSLHTELYFSKHGFSYNQRINEKDIDFVANLTSLSVPIMIRYSCPTNKLRPYVNTGVVGSYFIKNEALLYETYISDKTIVINDKQVISNLPDYRLGYCFGGGIEYDLNYKKSLFFEIRLNNQFNFLKPETFGYTSFNIFAGINL
jgi:hypothetical protein